MKESYCLPHQRHPVNTNISMDSRDISSITNTIRARKMSVDSARLAFHSSAQFPAPSASGGMVPDNQPAAIMSKNHYPPGFSMGRRMSYDNSFFNDVEAMSQIAQRSNQVEKPSSDMLTHLRSIYESRHESDHANDHVKTEEVRAEQSDTLSSSNSQQKQKLQMFQPTSKKLLRIQSSPNMLAHISDLTASQDRQGSDTTPPGNVQPASTEGALVKAASSAIVQAAVETPAAPEPAAPAQSSAVTKYAPRRKPSDDISAMPASSSASNTSGFLFQTRRLGAWLTKTAGERPVDVSQKDINTIVPNTF